MVERILMCFRSNYWVGFYLVRLFLVLNERLGIMVVLVVTV